MPRQQPEIPIGMEKVYRRFERWRNAHQGSRPPIPEKLWNSAAETARRHGIFRTAKVLRLDYVKLKHLTGSVDSPEPSTKPPAFFELVSPQAAGLSECVIEIEGRRGKIRVEWKGITAPDLAALSRTLWEQQ